MKGKLTSVVRAKDPVDTSKPFNVLIMIDGLGVVQQDISEEYLIELTNNLIQNANYEIDIKIVEDNNAN